MTDDEAQWGILSRANERGKFAIPVDVELPPQVQLIFERGLDSEPPLYTLLDVAFVAARPDTVSRVFKLTPAGMKRRNELLLMFTHDGAHA